jgi:hypothetical protein
MAGVGQELLNVPFGDMVQKLAFAIAEGQTKLDMNSAAVAKFMSEQTIKLPNITGDGATEYPLLSMGFFPQFYQFQEAIIEVKMAITMATSSEFNVGAEAKLDYGAFSASVNASYSSKYDYKVEGSSLLRVRMTPVPPPAVLMEYMEKMIQQKVKDSKILDAE